MRKLIYFVCCIFYISWLCSCQKEKEYPFDEQIKELESNPEAFITRIDTSLIGKIKTEKQATLFLLKSLSLYQINIQDKPDKQQLLYCIKLFSEKKKSHEHLQTLRLPHHYNHFPTMLSIHLYKVHKAHSNYNLDNWP